MSGTLHLIDRLLALGRNFQKLDRDREAQGILEKLAGFHGLTEEVGEMAHVSLAEVYLKQKKFVRARRHLTIALLYRPDCARYHHLMATALASGVKCDPDRADEHYRKALELEPDEPRVHSDYGLFCVRRDRTEEGVSALRRAADLAPDDPLMLARLVKGLCQAYRTGEARSALTAARFRHRHDSRFEKIYSDFMFRQLRKKQEADRKATRERWTLDDGPELLPFARPPLPETATVVRADGPETLPPPHDARPARKRQRKQG